MNTTADAIRRLIRSNENYYAPIMERAVRESRELCDTFRDQPDWLSGWAHVFACPVCTTQLRADTTMEYNPPNRFVCPNCGEVLTGQQYDEAWVYYYRIKTSQMLESVAICALMGDTEARDCMQRFVDFYAQHYGSFVVRVREGGKLMPQVLDEAVWCMNVMRALYPCRHFFTPQKRSEWYQKLFAPMAELINDPEMQTAVHNHVMWYKCAVGALALCFEDEALLDVALNGKLGIREQIRDGLTADGFWREGSPFYHYYTMEAFTGFCQLFALEYPSDPLISVLERAYLAPMALSPDGWHFPSINDGWFPTTLDCFADQIHRAAAAARSDTLWQMVDRIRQRKPQVMAVPVSLLIDKAGTDIVLWDKSNLAVVRQPVHAVLKSGVIVRSHMHKDYLSVVLHPFCKDLGTPGYGTDLYRSWYQVAASHNTIAVDYDQPRPVIPTHVELTDHGVRAVIDTGWEHVISANRTLTPDGDRLIDRTEIVLDGEHLIDWLFHAEGEASFATEPGEEVSIGDTCGYQYLTDVRSIECDDLKVSFVLDGKKLTLNADVRGLEVFAAKSPGNPSNELRTAIVLRTRSDKAVFEVSYAQETL